MTARQIAVLEAPECAANVRFVGGDFDGAQNRVGNLIGTDVLSVVGKRDVQVDEDGAGHVIPPYGTVTSGSIPGSGVGFKGRDGDTFLPFPASERPTTVTEAWAINKRNVRAQSGL